MGKLDEFDTTSSPPHLISGAGTSSLSGEYKSPRHLFLSSDYTDSDLNSPRSLSDHARQDLDLVNQYLSSRQHTRVNQQLPVIFCFPTLGTPTGLIRKLSPHLEMIQWLFLSHQPQCTITTYITVLCQLIIKGCNRVIQLFGHDPAVIHVPLTPVCLQLSSQSLEFQCAVTDFVGDLNIHFPSNKLLQNLPTLNILKGEKNQRHSYSPS